MKSGKIQHPPLPEAGIFPLPLGSLAMVVTQLSMTLDSVQKHQNIAWPEHTTIEALSANDMPRIRALVNHVGMPWLWWELAAMDDARLIKQFQHPDHKFYALTINGDDVGLCEFDNGHQQTDKKAEIILFGLKNGLTGSGLGRQLMAFVLAEIYAVGTRTIEVETCTLDHPKALSFYQKAGFKPQKQWVEVCVDPRTIGVLPKDCSAYPVLETVSD